MTTRPLGIAALVGFLLCVPFANWLIGNVGTVCVPQGPCLVPVLPGLLAPSGVLAAGAALVLRDVVQRCLGAGWGFAAIIVGSTLSAFLAPPALIAASALAFLLSEIADFAIYTPLQRRRLMLAVLLSSGVGLVIDSLVFLHFAFGSLDHLAGQIVGKAWAVLFSVPLIRVLRRVAPTPA